MSDGLMKEIEELLQLDDRIVEKAARMYHESGWKKVLWQGKEELECYGMAVIHQEAEYEDEKRQNYRKILSYQNKDVNEIKLKSLIALIKKRKLRHLESLDETGMATIINGVANSHEHLVNMLRRNLRKPILSDARFVEGEKVIHLEGKTGVVDKNISNEYAEVYAVRFGNGDYREVSVDFLFKEKAQ